MISRRFLYAAFAIQLSVSMTGAAPSVASPSLQLGGHTIAPPAATHIPFTCSVHRHLHTCGHITVEPGEHLYMQMNTDSPLDTALFCVPRARGGMICHQLHSADGGSTHFGPNGGHQAINVPVNVGVGAPDRETGTATGHWESR